MTSHPASRSLELHSCQSLGRPSLKWTRATRFEQTWNTATGHSKEPGLRRWKEENESELHFPNDQILRLDAGPSARTP